MRPPVTSRTVRAVPTTVWMLSPLSVRPAWPAAREPARLIYSARPSRAVTLRRLVSTSCAPHRSSRSGPPSSVVARRYSSTQPSIVRTLFASRVLIARRWAALSMSARKDPSVVGGRTATPAATARSRRCRKSSALAEVVVEARSRLVVSLDTRCTIEAPVCCNVAVAAPVVGVSRPSHAPRLDHPVPVCGQSREVQIRRERGGDGGGKMVSLCARVDRGARGVPRAPSSC